MVTLENLILDVWVIIFLIFTSLELRLSKKLPGLRGIKTKIPQNLPILLVVSYLFLFGLLFYKDADIINKLFIFSLSLSILGHSLWLSSRFRYISAFVGILIVAFRILSPSILTHNIFVLASILWLGPILLKHKILNTKRLLIVSFLWLIYDIFYVWITGIAQDANLIAQSVGFPMGIISSTALLGSADLFWSNLLISVIKVRRSQIITIIALVASDIALAAYLSSLKSVVIFPLLVVWIPIGLFLNFKTFYLFLKKSE
jgi:hypothetical protein